MTNFSLQFDTAAQYHMFQHGESVSYYRYGKHNPSALTATVVRNELEIIREVGDVSARSLILAFLPNTDQDIGLVADDVNTDFDFVEVPYRVGESPSRFQVCKVLSSHGGLTRIFVQ